MSEPVDESKPGDNKLELDTSRFRRLTWEEIAAVPEDVPSRGEDGSDDE